MRVKILFFATLRERAGAKATELDVPDRITIKDLKDRVAAEFPNLAPSMANVLVSVNREYAFEDAILPPDAEVAMFPPVSGG